LYFVVFCPHKDVGKSWKSEALHQLCGALKELGYSAVMWYTDENCNNFYNCKTELQEKYNVTTTNLYRLNDIDVFNAVWILPDTYKLSFYKELRKARRVLWFLDLPQTTVNTLDLNHRKLKDYIFLSQCHYGLTTLKRVKLIQPLFQLTDYLDPYFLCKEEDLQAEQPIKQVIFNNTEGQNHIISLRALMPDVRFIGVSGLSPAVFHDLGLKSSVYLDFGPQHQFSRALRTAVALGCVPVVQGVNAMYSQLDVPIPDRYKIKQDEELEYDYEEIKNLIVSIFRNFESCLESVSPFRNAIREQNQKFYSSVQSLIDQLS
jgi:hypothetical protein